MKKYWFIYVAAAVIIIGSVIIPDAVYASVPKVGAVYAQVKSVSVSSTVTGKIIASQEMSVCAESSIVIESVEVSEGEYVKKGDVLVKVDAEKTRMALLVGENPDYKAAQNIPQYIKAPSDGRICSLSAVKNMPADSGTELMKLIKTDSMKVAVGIGEGDASKVAVGQHAVISCSAFDGVEYDGRVETVGASATVQTGGQTTVDAVVEIENPDSRLKSGYTAKVKIITDTIDDAVCVPAECVAQADDGREYVYVLNGNGARRQYVCTETVISGDAVISSGLSGGERIVKNPDEITGDTASVIAPAEVEK